MKKNFVLLVSVLLLGCNKDSPIEYGGYSFSFPMKIRHAESLFHLNKRIAGRRIAKLDSNGCKEIQITHDQAFQDSSYVNFDSSFANQVDAVSFYLHEDVLLLKRNLEKLYSKQFEPTKSLDGEVIYYYIMELDGFVTLLLYTNVCDICAKQIPNTLERKPKTMAELKRFNEISVVAFTYNLSSKRHFDSYTTLDGYYKYSD